MRLGEIKNILSKVLNEQNKIYIENTQIYGGQAYRIENYSDIVNALQIIKDQEWNTTSFDTVQNIIDKQGSVEKTVILSAQDYNLINQYISNLNNKIPLFYGILETMVKPQNEYMINIKLPKFSGQNLDNLSAINKELNTIFKTINIDGEYEFKGFDVGTSWYEILIYGSMTYKALVLAIDLAQRFFGLQEQYYKTQEARISYIAAKGEEPKEKDLKEFAQNYIKLQIEVKAKESMDNMEESINTPENTTKITKTVELLMKQMSAGTEFHLSLNPPKGIEEINGEIQINYDEIRKMNMDGVPQIEQQDEE